MRLRSVTLLRERVADWTTYPFVVPAIRTLESLEIPYGPETRVKIKLPIDSSNSTCHRAVGGGRWIPWFADLSWEQSVDC